MDTAAAPAAATETMSMRTLPLAAFALLGAASAAAQPSVQTQYGTVTGFTANAVNNYLGIPYALPPTGALRFVAPLPPANWGTRQATRYSAYCPQGLSEIGPGGGSEDCLYLNVQTPANATPASNLPVMFWIHGGGLDTGSGQEYDGTSMVQKDNVVVVTFNYRLGPLGFLAHPALAAENQGRSGNYGLLDQQAALRFVQANIAAFGGNPKRVMVFGESAGGQSTIDQLYSATAPAFFAAGIHSGAYARSYPTRSQAEQAGLAAAALSAIGCGSDQTAACLRRVPAANWVAIEGAVGSPTGGGFQTAPNVDGWVLTDQPFQAFQQGRFQHVPVIEGSNHDEYRLFVSENDLLGSGPYTAQDYTTYAGVFDATAEYPLGDYPSPNYALSALFTDYGFSCGSVLLDAVIAPWTTLYSYELNDPNVPNIFLPYDPNLPSLGDSHAADLPYLWPAFRNAYLNLGPANFSLGQRQLSTSMQALWTSLARYGRPLNPRGGAWPAYAVAAHDRLSLVSPSPRTFTTIVPEHQCSFWIPTWLLQEAGLPQNTPY